MSSPEASLEDLESWVTWIAWAHNMPDWWQELTEVPGVDDHEKLAQEAWASFELQQQTSKWHHVENYHQAPSAPLCICQKSFLLLSDCKFACQDIRDLQQEKMVAYAQALKFWAEKANLPTQGPPCLLVGSTVELREEMKCYVPFSDEDVFSGMALPEEPSITQSKEADPESAQPTLTASPVKEAVAKVTKEPTEEKCPNQFPGWKEVIHPSRPVAATGQIPPISQGPK